MRYETEKLIKSYEDHKKIIVGVDFDNTLFPLTGSPESVYANAIEIRELLKAIRDKIELCLYTVADSQSIQYKTALMCLWEIAPDYINKSPVKPHGDCGKPYFNILLDDKAGLNEAIEILIEFKNNTR